MPNTREKLIEVLEGLFVDYGATAIFFTKGEAEVIADHLIANGVTFATDNNVGSKWIPVSERLPGSEGKYLCLWRYANEDEVTADVLAWDGERFPWENFCWKGQHIITHWMPLPEPPKEEKQ